MTDPTSKSRSVLHSGWGPFLWMLLFIAIFLVVYFVQKPSTLAINNSTIKEIFEIYGVAAGPVLALIGLVLLYVLALIKRIVGLRRFKVLNPIVVLFVSLPALAFGYQLAFREKPYTDIARAIIGSLSMPLLIASAVVSALALLWFVWILIRR